MRADVGIQNLASGLRNHYIILPGFTRVEVESTGSQVLTMTATSKSSKWDYLVPCASEELWKKGRRSG